MIPSRKQPELALGPVSALEAVEIDLHAQGFSLSLAAKSIDRDLDFKWEYHWSPQCAYILKQRQNYVLPKSSSSPLGDILRLSALPKPRVFVPERKIPRLGASALDLWNIQSGDYRPRIAIYSSGDTRIAQLSIYDTKQDIPRPICLGIGSNWVTAHQSLSSEYEHIKALLEDPANTMRKAKDRPLIITRS